MASALRISVLSALACSGFAGSTLAQLPVYVPAAEPLDEPTVPAPPLEAPRPQGAEEPLAPSVATPAPLATTPERSPAKKELLTHGSPPVAYDDGDDRPLEPKRSWYGWQTLVVDGAAFSALLIGAAANSNAGSDDGGTFVGVGLLGYEFGPGIVHFVHRNPGRGFASFGVRLGMPLAGAVLGASLFSNCDGYRCEEGGAAAGLLLGMAGAIALDAAVFAYDDRKPSPRGSTTLLPVASLLPGRAWLGVAGSL